MSDNTPTERVRELLDEHGIEWWQRKCHTCWKVEKEQGTEHWRAWLAPDGTITLKVDAIYGLTPEQAIAATVGAHSPNNPKLSDKVSDADELRTLVDALMLCDDVVHGDHDSCNECKLPGNGESRCLTMARRIGVFE